MVLLNKEVLPRVRSQVQLGSEHHYNLGDEFRTILNGEIFTGWVIEVKVDINNENNYTLLLDKKLDWFREAVQNALGGPPGR